MIPLSILFIVFLSATLINKWLYQSYRFTSSARIGMSAMLLFTALGHFIFTEGMSMMIPSFIPFKLAWVYITGVFEILLAIGLLFRKTQKRTAWMLIIFLVLMLPANIYAAMHNINYQEGTFDGHGADYLWFRIPLQVFFILWTFFSALHSGWKPRRSPSIGFQ